MFFSGRSFDTFEYALAMLNHGIRINEYMDVLSGRAFALDRNPGSSLFSCTLSAAGVAKNLNSFFNGAFYTVNPYTADKPFVIELKADIGVPTIFRKYYPFGHFVLCCRMGEFIIVNDPDGFPHLAFHLEELEFGECMGIAISDINMPRQLNIKEVIRRGKSLICGKLSEKQASDSRIFLQYAKRNYVLQTNKILSFLCLHLPETAGVISDFTELYSHLLTEGARTHEITNIIDKRICDLMEVALCV
jgi:hypothetical protein